MTRQDRVDYARNWKPRDPTTKLIIATARLFQMGVIFAMAVVFVVAVLS